jgi:outer membrane protein assembly factor BamB
VRLYLTIILTILTICSFGQRRQDPHDFLKSLSNPTWKFKTDFIKDYCIYNGIYLFDSILVIKAGMTEGCNKGKIYGLNNNTGQIIWEADMIAYEHHYYFCSNNIIYSFDNRIICLDLYTGKTKWTFDKKGYFIKDFKLYFSDSFIYFLVSNIDSQKNPKHYDISIENDSLGYTGVIALNQNTGEEMSHINNIFHRQTWRINFINKNIIVSESHKAITGFDCETNRMVWCFKKSNNFEWSGYKPPIELKKKYIEYSFLTGIGDTIFLSRRTSTKPFEKGIEDIIAVELKTGKIIATFFASELNEHLLQYGILKSIVYKNELYFVKIVNLSDKSFPHNGYANYVITCLDINKLKEKWEFKVLDDKEKWDVSFDYSNIQIIADSSSVNFSVDDNLICINAQTGHLKWTKKIMNSKILSFQSTNNFLIVTSYSIQDGDNNKTTTIIVDKENPDNTKNEQKRYSILLTNKNNCDLYLVDHQYRLLKVIQDKSAP